jgi:hypothetical protein
VSITVDDLLPFSPSIDSAKAAAMIEDALALAARVAPCINDPDFAYPEAAKAIIRGAILRWDEAGSGALQAQTAGPFGQTLDTRQQRRGMFWPSEINDLTSLCSSSASSYTTSLAGPDAGSGYWSQPDVWTPL